MRDGIVHGGVHLQGLVSARDTDGVRGAFMAPFLVMVFELRAINPRIAIFECTPGQPDNLLAALLEDLYFIDSVVLCPLEKGWPNRRPRKWPLSSTSRCYV